MRSNWSRTEKTSPMRCSGSGCSRWWRSRTCLSAPSRLWRDTSPSSTVSSASRPRLRGSTFRVQIPPAHRVRFSQRLGGLLDPSILDQPPYQLLARILSLLFGSAGSRQQHAGLEVNQLRGLIDVLARDVQIELLHHPQILVKLVTDQRDRDVRDLDLVDSREVQQQVERPLKHRQLYPPLCGKSRLMVGGGSHQLPDIFW